MARHIKKGLQYFNLDCDQEDNLNYVEAKHGITGYGIVVKLWRKIYQIDGYFCFWHEKNIYLFAREIGVEVSIINDVVETCFIEGIFSREKFTEFQILTSRGIQKRYKRIVTDAKRTHCQIDVTHSLLEILPEKKELSGEHSAKIRRAGTQSKVKYSKVNKSKRVNTGDESPPKSQPKKIKKFPVFFKESELFEKEKFTVALFGTVYQDADIDHYHEALLRWSESKPAKKADWLATAKNWMDRDKEAGKFKNKNHSLNGTHQQATEKVRKGDKSAGAIQLLNSLKTDYLANELRKQNAGAEVQQPENFVDEFSTG